MDRDKFGSDMAPLFVYDPNPKIQTQIQPDYEDYINFIYHIPIRSVFAKPVYNPKPTKFTKII